MATETESKEQESTIEIHLRELYYPTNIVWDEQSFKVPKGTDISAIVGEDIPYLTKLEFDMDPWRPIAWSEHLERGALKHGATYEVYRLLESKKKKDLYDVCRELEERLK